MLAFQLLLSFLLSTPDILNVAGLPAFAGGHGVDGVPAFAFVPAVAGILTAAVVPAVAIVLAVES